MKNTDLQLYMRARCRHHRGIRSTSLTRTVSSSPLLTSTLRVTSVLVVVVPLWRPATLITPSPPPPPLLRVVTKWRSCECGCGWAEVHRHYYCVILAPAHVHRAVVLDIVSPPAFPIHPHHRCRLRFSKSFLVTMSGNRGAAGKRRTEQRDVTRCH